MINRMCLLFFCHLRIEFRLPFVFFQMIHWGFFDINNNIVALQINDGIITLCAMDNVDSPASRKVITAETYRQIMQGTNLPCLEEETNLPSLFLGASRTQTVHC